MDYMTMHLLWSTRLGVEDYLRWVSIQWGSRPDPRLCVSRTNSFRTTSVCLSGNSVLASFPCHVQKLKKCDFLILNTLPCAPLLDRISDLTCLRVPLGNLLSVVPRLLLWNLGLVHQPHVHSFAWLVFPCPSLFYTILPLLCITLIVNWNRSGLRNKLKCIVHMWHCVHRGVFLFALFPDLSTVHFLIA